MTDSIAPSNLHTLYSDHQTWLLGWLRRKLNGSEQAADLMQDTFVRVLGRQDSPTLVREPRAWLTAIARGLLIDHWRRQEVERIWLEAQAAMPLAFEPSPEHRALLLEALQQIDAMLERMPSKVRRAFLMAQLQGLKYRQIAECMGVSERMVKKYMAQAMLHCIALDDEFGITDMLASGQHSQA